MTIDRIKARHDKDNGKVQCVDKYTHFLDLELTEDGCIRSLGGVLEDTARRKDIIYIKDVLVELNTEIKRLRKRVRELERAGDI